MENTDLIKIDDENNSITIYLENHPLRVHSVLISLVVGNIEAIKEIMGETIANGTAFATMKMIAEQYQEAYDDLQKHGQVQSVQIN